MMTMDTTTTTSSSSASKLVSDLDGLATTLSQLSLSTSPIQSSTVSTGPSPKQFHDIGLFLFQYYDERNAEKTKKNNNYQNEDIDDDIVFSTFQQLVDTIPHNILQSTFSTLCEATMKLMDQSTKAATTSSSSLQVDLIQTCQCLFGLFCNAPSLCHIVYTNQWMTVLSTMYDQFVAWDTSQQQKDVLLSIISCMLLDGMFFVNDNTVGRQRQQREEQQQEQEQQLQQVLEAIRAMEEVSVDCLRDVQIWQTTYSNSHRRRRTLESCIQQQQRKHNISSSTNPTKNSNDDEEDGISIQQQREYILSMLESARQQPASAAEAAASAAVSSVSQKKAAFAATTTTKRLPQSTSSSDELDRRIQQVKSILPNFGEGFIEAALSLYKGDVERTVETLLQEDYPISLKILDPTLPRRQRDRSSEEMMESIKARQLVKEQVVQQQKVDEEKYKALLYVTASDRRATKTGTGGDDDDDDDPSSIQCGILDEYNDDYDDQYDDVDVRLGNTDSGFASDPSSSNNTATYEQVKLYNQMVREDEAEDAFWEESRNWNRVHNDNDDDDVGPNRRHNNDDDDDDEGTSHKKYRGPDKIRGGRIVGPDGKIIRNPNGSNRGRKGPTSVPTDNNNGNNNNNNNPTGGRGGGGGRNQQQYGGSRGGGRGRGRGSNQGRGGGGQTTTATTTAATTTTNNNNSNKPRTSKPKSDNRMNRQRDKKQQKQGVFGIQE